MYELRFVGRQSNTGKMTVMKKRNVMNSNSSHRCNDYPCASSVSACRQRLDNLQAASGK